MLMSAYDIKQKQTQWVSVIARVIVDPNCPLSENEVNIIIKPLWILCGVIEQN